ncbi:MAG: hypothetical protein LUE12_02705 [Ruminococcus sp.]|nr:hypothetical protein [Ruminococcus sp.]
MRKIILNNVLILVITLAFILSYCIFHKEYQITVRKVLLDDDNATLTIENIDADLIDNSQDESTVMFVFDEYSINNDNYLCVVEYITNDGCLKGFKMSGSTEDSGYQDVTDIETITYLAFENEASGNAYVYSKLSEEELYNLQLAYKELFNQDLGDFSFSILTDDAALKYMGKIYLDMSITKTAQV